MADVVNSRRNLARVMTRTLVDPPPFSYPIHRTTKRSAPGRVWRAA